MTDNVNDTPFEESNGRNEKYQKKEFNPNNYLNTRLGPNETKKEITVRFLPIEKGSSKIGATVKMHQMKVSKEVNESGYIKMQCLNDEKSKIHDERGCPFCKRFEEFRKEANKFQKGDARNKSFWDQSKIYEQRTYYIVRCIERGHEDEGVKYWRFAHHWDGSGIKDQLDNIHKKRKEEKERYTGEKGYNVFNVENGRDFTITITKDTNPNKKGSVYTIIDNSFEYPVTKDTEQLERWLTETSWQDMFSAKRYDYMEVILNGGIPMWSKVGNCYKDSKEVEKEKNEAESFDGKTPSENPVQTQQTAQVDDSSALPF